MGEKASSSHCLYYRIAVASCALSLGSLAFLAISLPTLYRRTDVERLSADVRSEHFKERTNTIWSDLMAMTGSATSDSSLPPAFASARRPKRQYTDNTGFCHGCVQLTCPNGPPGPPGGPGNDGKPGDVGGPGQMGDDGYDVQLEMEPELPCVVCGGGPPGPRGPQGERGRPGNAGPQGHQGPDGFYGKDGHMGPIGGAGRAGPRGEDGLDGPRGDTVIAGIGIKGPKGPPGPQGVKGRPGPRGKPSYGAGLPGKPGTAGIGGGPGAAGDDGSEGMAGPPGEPGMPASYCPSDCGVQHIMTGGSSGMLGEKMTNEEVNNMPSYVGYRRRKHDFVHVGEESAVRFVKMRNV